MTVKRMKTNATQLPLLVHFHNETDPQSMWIVLQKQLVTSY